MINDAAKTNNPFRLLLWTATISSFAGAVTTFLLFTIPAPEAPDFESQVRLFQNSLYVTKLWILFIHPQLNFLACLGVVVLLWERHAPLMIISLLFMFVWMYTEVSQQAFIIDALNQFWRPEYLQATENTAKNTLATLIKGASAYSDSQYFIVIYAFGIGSIVMGMAMIQEIGLIRWIGIAQLFIGILSLASFIRYYLGWSNIGMVVNWCYEYIYFYIQPLTRILIGIWIFRVILKKQTEALS
ncbi:hypothetical protein L6Q79_08235 [bacterium]|nr:hypothetical protein [bacterium]NUN45595.1 hypothetical protein [bacterium]